MREEQRLHNDVALDAPNSAEIKRLAARRRFLAGAAAGGSGLLIVTLCHQRASANPLDEALATSALEQQAEGYPEQSMTQKSYTPHGVLVSSTLACASLHGSAVKNVTVLSSVTGHPVTRVDCIRS